MKCDKCGDFVNWDDHDTHYHGHTCSEKGLQQAIDCKKYGLDLTTYKQKLYLHEMYGEPMPDVIKSNRKL
jgi:hypothetical protein